jgi:hypothetical protein
MFNEMQRETLRNLLLTEANEGNKEPSLPSFASVKIGFAWVLPAANYSAKVFDALAAFP